ncbi:MAG TPA: tRNA-dihydrouridine synthase [Patescibacteria group bacterium]|nr:tRNA-dihydrouridine synthase [Patescibacteria group bacterium]
MENFWHNLPRPIFCLAPMEEVTDVAFREMFARYSAVPAVAGRKPRHEFVMFTEFINIDGLLHPQGFEKFKADLSFTPIQHPIVIQLWGTDPAKFERAAALAASLGFDGIDINMGCPQEKEIGLGACAALIRQPKLAQEIILAAKAGAAGLPVSVKTRLGYSRTDEMADWVMALLQTQPAALTLHARTKKEMSKVPAHWDKIAEAVELRDKWLGTRDEGEDKIRTLILGNGDINSRAAGLARAQESGCDGVMIGRGAFGNPWLFRADNYEPAPEKRLQAMLEHAALFEQLLPQKPFVIMRKHFKAYCSGFAGAHELRARLLQSKTLAEARVLTDDFLAAAGL